MPEQTHIELLAGCVYSAPTQWPGRVQLLETRDAEQFQLLEQMPGVYFFRGNRRKKQEQAWYLPQSLVDAGRYPGILHDYSDDVSALTPNMQRALREHQRRAVSFLQLITPQREGAILGADMGLGKCTSSLQSLYLDNLLEKPGIVCGPLSSASAWVGPRSDATKHFDIEIKRLEGKKNLDTTQLQKHQHFFVNYDILPAWVTWLCVNVAPAWLIFDEIHLLMHETAQRSDAAYRLSHWHSIQRRIGLTGTPIPNTRLDLWSQLRIVQPRQWGESKHQFGVRYCGGRREVAAGEDGSDEREYWTYDEETNDVELRQRLAGTLLRYTRFEVKSEMPELIRERVLITPTVDQLAEYEYAERNIVAYLQHKGELEVGARTVTWGNKSFDLKASEAKPQAIRLRAISTLIGLLSDIKAQAAILDVCESLQRHDRIVVFAWRRKSAAEIVKGLTNAIATRGAIAGKVPVVFGPIDGSLKQAKRQSKAEEFASMSTAIYVATLGAAGISINELAAASCVTFSDLHWNTSDLAQAESRVHRDGSMFTAVESRFLVVKDTIDELLLHHLTSKADAAAAVAKNDLIGQNIVADLSSDRGISSEQAVDHICALLSQMEDDEDGRS